jgi:hypothetical protein
VAVQHIPNKREILELRDHIASLSNFPLLDFDDPSLLLKRVNAKVVYLLLCLNSCPYCRDIHALFRPE